MLFITHDLLIANEKVIEPIIVSYGCVALKMIILKLM